MRYKQTEEERQKLLDDVTEETKRRLDAIMNGRYMATYGEDGGTRDANFNLKYATQPMADILSQYNHIVGNSQGEIDSLHRMLSTKKLDKMKLEQENNKYLAINGKKHSWQCYEGRLANERVMNMRLQDILRKTFTVDKLVDEGKQTAYEECDSKAAQYNF